MNSDFKDLLELLNRFGARYLVVGGYAVMLYSEPRYTKDIDLAIGTSEADIYAVARALDEFGFPMTAAAIEELRLPNRMISIGRAPSRIDILNEISGVDFERAWERKFFADVEGIQVPFISLGDLVDAKQASGRPQDWQDLKALNRAAQNKPDV